MKAINMKFFFFVLFVVLTLNLTMAQRDFYRNVQRRGGATCRVTCAEIPSGSGWCEDQGQGGWHPANCVCRCVERSQGGYY